MTNINKFVRLSKVVFFIVFIPFFMLSCAAHRIKMKEEKRNKLGQNAIKWVLEYRYRNAPEGRRWPPIVRVHPEMYILDLLPWVKGLLSEPSGYLKKAGCNFSKEERNLDTTRIVELPEVNIPFEVELKYADKANWKKQGGDFFVFSPLIETTKKNEFCIVSQMTNYESTEFFIFLIKRNNNNKFSYVDTIDGLIVHD